MNLPIYIERENVKECQIHSKLPHYHTDIELIYVLKGSVDCQTNDETFPLSKGDICFINRNQIHQLYCNNNLDCSHISLIVSSNLLTKNKEIYDKYIEPILEDLTFSHVKFESTEGYSTKIHDYILKIEKLIKNEECGYELEVVSYLHMIFKYLYLTYIKKDEKPHILDENSIIQQKMIKYIENNYQDEITIDDIASSGSVSRSKCFRLFKEYTRMSPINYLNNYRLEIAASMLINTKDTVSNIALNAGFSQASYFNRLFLRQYGFTPVEYRKRNV